MRFLIIKISAMGDILHALPVLQYLKQASPDCEIDWIVEESFADLLTGNPLISRLHIVQFKKWKKSPFSSSTINEIINARKLLTERKFDLAFDIQGNIKSGIVCALSGAKKSFGFTDEVLQERLNRLFTGIRVPLKPEDVHVSDQYLRLISAPFDMDFSRLELKSEIFTSPEDDDAAAKQILSLNADKVLFFHYGTTWQTKFWSEESWIELGKSIISLHPDCSILFSWGNDTEQNTAKRLAAAIGAGAKAAERYPLKRLTALLKKVDIVVGGDTGPVHLAAAVGTPTVSYYRASNGRRSGPRSSRDIVIQAPMSCTACFRTKCERDKECRESITVQAIAMSIEKLLYA